MVSATKLYPFTCADVDRHGNLRVYFRRKGFPKVRLPRPVGSDEFVAAYKAAFAASENGAAKPSEAARSTWRWLCLEHFKSPEWLQLDPGSTQRPRRLILESTWKEPIAPGSALVVGDFPLNQFNAKVVRMLRDRKAKYPDAANNRVKAVRRVFKWAIESGLLDNNPARDVPLLRTRAGGIHTWSMEEITKFEARWSIGTKERLAFAIMRYLGVRRSDAVRIGRQHVTGDAIRFNVRKGRRHSPTTLELPILPELRQVLDASKLGDLTFLVTEYGVPFTDAGFGNWFRRTCDDAGLTGCTAHGLRKAAATSLAEAGASAHQLMAWFGWKSLKEAERYTRAASQKKLAADVVSLVAKGR
jgi:integrase